MIDTAPLRRKLLDLAITGKLVPRQGEWQTVKLEDLCVKIGAGSTPRGGKSVYVAQGVKFLREQNIYCDGIHYDGIVYISEEVNNAKKGSQVFAKDILMNITGGSIGRTALVPDDFDVANVNQHVLIIRLKNLDYRQYVHLCLCSPKFTNLMFERQTGDKPGLSAEKVKKFPIPLPPIAEQKAIVKRLEELLKLEGEIAVESAALDDLITAAKRKILSLAISGRLVPWQGEWKSVKLGEMCEVINGLWKGVKKPFVNVGVIRAANFTKDCKLNLEKTVYIDVEAGKYETRKLQEDDLIVERSGGGPGQPVGRVVLFPKVDGEYSISNFTSILRITDWRTASPKYLHMALVSIYNTGYTEKIQTQTTNLHNLNFKEYLNIPIPLPSLAEQKRIVARVEKLFNVLDGAVPR